MNYRDKMKQSQQQGNDFPNFQSHIIQRYDLSEDADGNTAFRRWDKTAEENRYIKEPLQGIYLGDALQLSAFSDEIGANGGTFTSSYYFTNDNKIALFKPTSKGYEKITSGDIKFIESYISDNATGNIKKRKIIFLLIKEGVISIETNLIIYISHINALRKVDKDVFIDNMMKLVPMRYDAANPCVDKRAQGFLGKFVIKNPPRYVDIETGKSITDKIIEEWGAEKVIDDFISWREFITQDKVDKLDEVKITEKIVDPDTIDPIDLPNDDEPSDLPF